MKLTALLVLASGILAAPLQDYFSVDELLWADTFNSLPEIDTTSLQNLIEVSALESRAKSLYNIALTSADEYGHPTRVIGSPGHWNTISYITRELRKLDSYYKISTQPFNATDGKVNSFSLLIDGQEPKSLAPLTLTPPTPNLKPVHGNLVLVNGNGCSKDDFPHFSKDNIVLIKRGECSFQDKSINAGRAGALGVVIYNEGGPFQGTISSPTGEEVASVTVDQKEIQKYIDELTKSPKTKIETTLYIDSYVKQITTLNVIAETRGGDHNNFVSLGAHSDSVSAGPGLNDDGSGTISLIEVAKQLTKFKVKNAVRFAWWAAEEEGLIGSNYYAESLSESENQKIRVFMDYDMMASPNFINSIYDANNEEHPNGSGNLRDLYIDFYKSRGLNYTLEVFDGRSDYVGFLDAGIPCGGIAAGAEGVKNKKLQEQFGGEVGKWFDPCYHQLCDDLDNLNYDAWIVNTQLIAHSVAVYAKSFDDFPKRTKLKNIEKSNFKFRGSKLIL